MDLTGEYEDRNFIVTRGDSRVAITIARNADTAKLGRLDRFLIDDPESEHKLAYALTKPLKFAGTYGKTTEELNGVYKFVLQEVVTTDDDNEELGIADYYRHFLHEPDEYGNPIVRTDAMDLPEDPPDESGKERKQWL